MGYSFSSLYIIYPVLIPWRPDRLDLLIQNPSFPLLLSLARIGLNKRQVLISASLGGGGARAAYIYNAVPLCPRLFNRTRYPHLPLYVLIPSS